MLCLKSEYFSWRKQFKLMTMVIVILGAIGCSCSVKVKTWLLKIMRMVILCARDFTH